MNLNQELKRFVTRGSFDLKGRAKSDIYLNLKEAYGEPEILSRIVYEFTKVISKEVTCVAALGLGGIPPATMLSAQLDLKLILLRESIKDHGIQRLIEGYYPKEEDMVAIIDDVFTVGTSLKKSIGILNTAKANILGCYVVVKRGEGNLSVPLHHLYTLDELL